jgi:outer membrane protein assembly factor BamB
MKARILGQDWLVRRIEARPVRGKLSAGRGRLRRDSVRLVTVFGLVIVGVAGSGVAASNGASTASGTSWTVYHGDPAGDGDSTALKSVNTARRAWTSPSLVGQLYGEPLVYSNRVYVATEENLVYALSAVNGKIAWARHLAPAVPSSDLPCSDISPTEGITGTPVIDPSRNEIFVVADELVNGHPQHWLVGLNTTSGAVELRQRADPPGSYPPALLQRSGLNLDAGHVIFAMGGNYGDCSTYHGQVGSISETGSAARFFTVDSRPGDSQGAIWMGGAAPAIDIRGDIWAGAGNGSVHTDSQPYDDSDSALQLTPTLRLRQFFAPSSWASDNASDLDVSTVPTLLADGQVVLAGKSPNVYLLNGAHLGGIGHPEATLAGACNNDIDGGAAVVNNTVYLPCLNGPVAVQVSASPPGLRVLWRASVGGGPPIVAAGLVWTEGQNGTLYGLSPTTGAVRPQATVGNPANHFPTPSVGDSLLLTTSATQVVAFRGSAN